MSKPTDTKAGRKAAAASADDQGAFEETPFGRQRKQSPFRAFVSRIVHFVGFPFFYVYNQVRSRKHSDARKWFDEGGRHGVASNLPAPADEPGKK